MLVLTHACNVLTHAYACHTQMIHSVIVHQCGFIAHCVRRAMEKLNKKFTIGFIGCGRIGKAIVRYLLDSGELRQRSILV